jgi:hypothetical protein
MTREDQHVRDYYSGDSLDLVVTVKNDDGDVVDISGADATWVLAPSEGRPSVVEKTTGSGISLTDAANGEVTISIDPSDTENKEGLYYHELQITDDTGNVSTALSGEFEIKRDTA